MGLVAMPQQLGARRWGRWLLVAAKNVRSDWLEGNLHTHMYHSFFARHGVYRVCADGVVGACAAVPTSVNICTDSAAVPGRLDGVCSAVSLRLDSLTSLVSSLVYSSSCLLQ